MITYVCDRCQKPVEYVYEVNWRVLGINPAAQYQPPESCHLCARCVTDLRSLKEGFGVIPTARKLRHD